MNYFQSVTPTLSLGGEAFWLANQMKSGVGIAGRYANKGDVATCQVATTGLVSLTYAHKISDKVCKHLCLWISRGLLEPINLLRFMEMENICEI